MLQHEKNNLLVDVTHADRTLHHVTNNPIEDSRLLHINRDHPSDVVRHNASKNPARSINRDNHGCRAIPCGSIPDSHQHHTNRGGRSHPLNRIVDPVKSVGLVVLT